MRMKTMRLLNLFELQQRWVDPKQIRPAWVVAFRGRYWIIPVSGEGVPIAVAKELLSFVGQQSDWIEDGDDMKMFADDLGDLMDRRTDIIVATLNKDNNLFMFKGASTQHHPVASQMLKKLVAELKTDGIWIEQPTGWDDHGERWYPPEVMQGKIPDTLYHGTNSINLKNIARIGLRPGQTKSNWADMGIDHPNVIFGTSSYEDVIFHANKTAGLENVDFDDENRLEISIDPDEWNFPVIIQFKIPDPTKIIPDYDIASSLIGRSQETNQYGYANQKGFADNPFADEKVTIHRRNHPEGRSWKYTGIYGYTGWIPPKFITQVYSEFYGPLISQPGWSGTIKEFFQGLERRRRQYYNELQDELDDEDY